jgi:hypothetical protein
MANWKMNKERLQKKQNFYLNFIIDTCLINEYTRASYGELDQEEIKKPYRKAPAHAFA